MQPLGEGAVNVPAFLNKLWNMVNDPQTDYLISWNENGTSFIIANKAQFWYELLPFYYKHNNMSSFVRQLNMYGFHKLSTVENGTMDIDKDEIQFFHPNFQRDQPELLKNIKRKVTTHRPHENNSAPVATQDLAKALSDVKQLRGKQNSVDAQLASLKEENSVLWRELALLRQKHMKQQQIVNKLIQFLVSMVHQPNTNSRMGVGVKRRMPLMINESPIKKQNIAKQKKPTNKNSSSGPTIHEIENQLSQEEFIDNDIDNEPIINSPLTPSTSTSQQSTVLPQQIIPESPDQLSVETNSPQMIIESPQSNTTSLLDEVCETNDDSMQPNYFEEFVEPQSTTTANINDFMPAVDLPNDVNNVFLNPTTRDTLISNIVNGGSYNASALSTAKFADNRKKANKTDIPTVGNVANNNTNSGKMALATRDSQSRIKSDKPHSREDLDLHIENTESDLDQFKEFLSGYSIDANALLGLFNDETPNYGLPYNQNNGEPSQTSDPLVSGSELAPFNTTPVDFNELLDDSLDENVSTLLGIEQPTLNTTNSNHGSIDTPLVIKTEPFFQIKKK